MANENASDWQTLKRILGLSKPYQGLFWWTAFLALILAPISVLRPYLINQMVDDYILKADLDGMKIMFFILLGAVVLQALIRYLFIFYSSLLGQNIVKDLRSKVFKHLINLQVAYFDRTPVGQSTTRTVNDVEAVNQVFSQGVLTIMADVLTLLVVFTVMMLTSWKLTLITLVTLPLMIYGSYIFKEKVKQSYQRVRTQISRMNTFLNERIGGLKTIQIFGVEKAQDEAFGEINSKYRKANLDSIFYYAVFFPFVEIISAISVGLMLWYGAARVMEGVLSAGTLVAFPIYINMMFRPLRQIADRFNTLQMGMVAANRIFGVLDDSSQIEDTGQMQKQSVQGSIAFDEVYFSYDGKQDVLKGISFQVPAGTSLAILGTTGSGKSTIVNLLNRFYEYDQGKISLDDVDIRDYKLAYLRSQFAIILQDIFLFTGSVLDNIRLRNDAISRAQVETCAERIGAAPFIDQLPDAYDYILSERGSNLSMGQRQLICFVRALVFEPQILILDEATSSVDPETESVVQQSIERMIEGRTSIIIAHRLSTIQHCDQIIVLDQGKIVEQGKPADLLKLEDGHYRQMYEMQMQGAE